MFLAEPPSEMFVWGVVNCLHWVNAFMNFLVWWLVMQIKMIEMHIPYSFEFWIYFTGNKLYLMLTKEVIFLCTFYTDDDLEKPFWICNSDPEAVIFK